MKTNRKRAYEWMNPLETADKAKTMSGFDFLNSISKGETPLPPIAETLEFHPLSVEIGKVVFEFEAKEYHYNPIDSVHGGVISTVLDTVMGCAVASVLLIGIFTTGIISLALKIVNTNYTGMQLVNVWFKSWGIAYKLVIPCILVISLLVDKIINKLIKE